VIAYVAYFTYVWWGFRLARRWFPEWQLRAELGAGLFGFAVFIAVVHLTV
jgi:hypothetical protein